jgi:ABC-2 type transport system permease protein
VVRSNPVNWAARAGRSAVLGATDCSLAGTRVGALVVPVLVAALAATRTFRPNQPLPLIGDGPV